MSTTRNTDTVEVIMRDQRRRRWSLAEKAALVRRSYEPGMNVSLVACQEGVIASLSRQRHLAQPKQMDPTVLKQWLSM